jgi:hypothetical protein
MKREKVLALGIMSFLFLSLLGVALYGFFIPGNILNLLKTGSYTKKIDGAALFAGNENGPQYTVEGNLFTATGDHPYFVIDIANEPRFAFVRVKISNLKGMARGEINFLTDTGQGYTKWAANGSQELVNGINVFAVPRDFDIQALRFAMSEADGASFNLEYVMLTNNWHIPATALAKILATAMAVTLMLYYLAWSVFASLPAGNSRLPVEAVETIDRHIFGLLWVLASAISLSYAAVMTLIKPNTYLDTERLERLYLNYLQNNIHPEPHEFTRFALYCVLICVFALGGTLLCRKYLSRIPSQVVRATNPTLLCLSALALFLPFYQLATFGNKDYLKYLTFERLLLAGGLFLLCGCAFFTYRRLKQRFPRLRLAVFLVDAATVWLIYHFSMLQRYYNIDNYYHKHHFSVVFNPIFELANGHTPGVDFVSPQYGLHGYVFYCLQKIIWGNVRWCDTIALMGGLVFLGNVALYVFLVKILHQRFIAAVTMAAIIYFTQMYVLLTYSPAPHYAYLPIRTVVPMLTLCLISFVHAAKKPRARLALYVCTALTATGGILWNPETGLVAVLALAGYMVYCSLCEYSLTETPFWKKTGSSLAIIVGSFCFWFLLLQLVTVRRSGAWYPPSSLLWSLKVFAKDGVNMFPLPARHPYVYVLWAYSIVVIMALYALFAHKAKPNVEAYNRALGLATGLMGFGLFTYYLGRTQVDTFMMPIWPAYIALAFIAMKLGSYSLLKLSECKANGWAWRKDAPEIVSGGIAGIASLAFVFFLFATGFFLYIISGTDRLRAYNEARTTVVLTPTRYCVEVVRRYQTDRLLMLNEYSMFYLSELGLENDYRGPATSEIYFKQDYLDILSQLAGYEGRVFIAENILPSDPGALTVEEWGMLRGTTTFADGETFDEKLQRLFAEKYVLLAVEGGWVVYDSK